MSHLIHPTFTTYTLQQPLNFASYLELMKELVKAEATTGPEQSESLAQFTKLNLQRIERQLKRGIFAEPQASWFSALPTMEWWLISEAWCGDAAQNLPTIAQLAQKLDIPLHIVLREEHPEMMSQYLTQGAKAIPILVMRDAQTGKDLAVWGPRPAPAQEIVMKAKKEGTDFHEWHISLHQWYNQDKNATLQAELFHIIEQLASR